MLSSQPIAHVHSNENKRDEIRSGDCTDKNLRVHNIRNFGKVPHAHTRRSSTGVWLLRPAARWRTCAVRPGHREVHWPCILRMYATLRRPSGTPIVSLQTSSQTAPVILWAGQVLKDVLYAVGISRPGMLGDSNEEKNRPGGSDKWRIQKLLLHRVMTALCVPSTSRGTGYT